MADDNGVVRAERFHQSHHVADQVENGISGDRLGPIAASVAALVGRDRAITGRRQRRNLVTPGIPALRPAVTKQHQRPAALPDIMQAHTVDMRETVFQFLGHVSPFSR